MASQGHHLKLAGPAVALKSEAEPSTWGQAVILHLRVHVVDQIEHQIAGRNGKKTRQDRLPELEGLEWTGRVHSHTKWLTDCRSL